MSQGGDPLLQPLKGGLRGRRGDEKRGRKRAQALLGALRPGTESKPCVQPKKATTNRMMGQRASRSTLTKKRRDKVGESETRPTKRKKSGLLEESIDSSGSYPEKKRRVRIPQTIKGVRMETGDKNVQSPLNQGGILP